MSAEELKPCPFCGSLAALFDTNGWNKVICNSCDMCVSTYNYTSAEEAIAQWNRRANTVEAKNYSAQQANYATGQAEQVGVPAA